VKEVLPAGLSEKTRLYLRDLPEEVDKLIWEMQAQALAPLVAAGKLGCVLFQFPHWFTARRAHIDYLKQLRDRSDWPLGVEFRGGGWMTDNYVPKRSLSWRSWVSPMSWSTSRRVSVRRRCRSWHRRPRSLSSASTAKRRDLRETEHQRRRTISVPYTARRVEELGRSDPQPRRTGRPGARADEQLLRRLRGAQRAPAGRAAGGSVTSTGDLTFIKTLQDP